MDTLPRLLTHPALRIGTLLVLVLGSLAISYGSLDYFADDNWPQFVVEKLPLSSEAREEQWLLALQVHVVAAAVAFPGCLALLSRGLLRRAPRVHRHLGRVVGVVVLFALAPSGLFMALFAKGGLAGVVGFLLTGVIVVVAMVAGIVTARRRKLVAHRRAMLHVVAQMSVAVTSRLMMFALAAAHVDADTAYLIALWLPVIGSALLVEMLVARPTSAARHRDRSPHVALRDRVVVAGAAVVAARAAGGR